MKFKMIGARTRFLHKMVGTFMPAKKPLLFTGKQASLQLCQTIPYQGHQKVLIVTDAMLIKLGIIEPIQKCLEENGMEVFVFGEVEPDPTDKVVIKGAKYFNENTCDCVLAVGGGSSIDASKAIASMAPNEGMSIKALANPIAKKKRAKNIYAIPTTSGTGSEVSVAAVISDSVSHEKFIVAVAGMAPLAAAIDTDIIKGMPPQVTAPTGLDALTHAVEAFVSAAATKDSDVNAKAAVVMIMENLPKAYHNGDDLKARDLMGMAAFQAGYAFSVAGLGYVHSISHRLSKHYGTPHGLANALVLPHVLDYSKDEIVDQLAELASAIGEGNANSSNDELAQLFIDRIYAINKELGIPEKLDKLLESDLADIAVGALKEAHFIYAVPKYMDHETCEGVVRNLLP